MIEQQDRYLIFRPGKSYKLYYWDDQWQLVGEQVATIESPVLEFTEVPANVLMLLVPEYSERKERLFIIMDDGTRYWW